ncbi:hypothetical protein OKW33_006289 [Paraburkholderia atlantica]|uniref:Uncharacterized protein n=1 Tax=Paraburkholderia atlantica TaxID=2654982 RepID=A0A6I1PTU8_PARAM|nr:hypothetical protein [Paraburkholderia atlantica]MBB5428769.1 hypothetical protein [Paraburkholderia atlantica]MPW08346.1 hypothetical protein [Paraburkholderia atlantica]NUY34482.1 hypothetical protein [Paraburkholderia atlantica]
MPKNFFSKTALARTASAPYAHANALVITLLALFLAAFHRYEGFAEPYQVWFRLDEIQYPSRNRVLVAGTFAVVYFVASTLMHDGRQYLASHDADQLMQMLADVLGLGLALVWLSWPALEDGEPSFA